ncbi:MAG: hypothetical protein AAB966_03020 [Patescibacteria group bacterium]
MTGNVVLKEHQKDHFNRLKQIISFSKFYIDESPTGTGKTFVTLALAAELGMKIFLVANKTALTVWKKVCKEVDFTIDIILTYGELRGIKSSGTKNLKHGFLIREDIYEKDATNKPIHRIKFHPTDKLIALIGAKTLFVFDEGQALRNNTAQNSSATAICNAITLEHPSKFAILSATSHDSEIQSLNFARMIGIVSHTMLAIDGRFEKFGIGEMVTFCHKIDSQKTEKLMNSRDLFCHRGNYQHIIHRLYTEIVVQNVASSMPPLKTNFSVDAKNGYYKLDGEKLIELNKGIQNLAQAARAYDDGRGNFVIYGSKSQNFSAITQALMNIEKSKIGIFVRVAKETLEHNPQCKVILYVSYLNTIAEIERELSDYKMVVLTGSVNGHVINSEGERMDKREHLIQQFQEDDETRIFVSVIQVGKEAISLHDLEGTSPRYMFISPSYNLIDMIQAMGRVYREGIKSDVTVRFLYAKGANKEMNILNAMARKSSILKEVNKIQTEEASKTGVFIKYPGEFDQYVED